MFQVLADFDGDGRLEAAAAYRQADGVILEVYKHDGLRWTLQDRWTGSGYRIYSMYEAEESFRSGGADRLVISWQAGDGPLYWSVYDWVDGRLQETERSESPEIGWRTGEEDPLRGPGLFPAPIRTIGDTMYGFINRNGRLEIPPRYDYAEPFQDNGLAIVQVKDRSGAIDRHGRYRVEPVYGFMNPFSEGLSVVSDKEGYKVVDETGKVITDKAYDYISSYKDGRALYSVNREDGSNAYGYLDRSGREVIPAAYREGTDFHGGRAVVKKGDNDYLLIGRNGETLAVYPYPYVGPLSGGLLAFQKEPSGKYGYLNEQGKVVIEPQYTGAQAFEDGRAVVNTAEDYNNRYGLIDAKGRTVVRPAYNEIRPLGAGRWALGKPIKADQPYMGSRYAIADGNGQVLTGFLYYDVADYHKGYASVNDGRNTYFIDRSGRKAPGLPVVSGTGTLTFDGPLIRADVDQRVSYLDRNGRVVWEENRRIPLVPPYEVLERKYKPNRDYLVYYPEVSGMADKAAQRQVNEELKRRSQVKPVDPQAQLESSYTGDFNVTFFRDRLLVLELNGYDYPFGAAHGMPSKVYEHVDLVTGRFYKLEELFKPGSDYVKVLSGIVADRIKNDPQYDYVWPDQYKGIKPDQPFYVTGEALHLYFAPYEIAPYAAGFPTFTIPFREIDAILNKEGAFWRSFH